jgi:DNA-directed RNA polymerase beta' subunit
MPKNPTDYRTALKRGKFEDVEDKDIDYEFVSPNQLFSYSMNIMPLMNAVPSQRAFYGDKFSLQTVAVENGDIPWVQSADTETGKSYDSIVGHKVGSVFSDDDDDTITITDVTPDEIRYTNSKGQPKVKELYNNFTFNRKTGISSIPLVKKGDVIEGKGKRILARSNYTSNDGSLAMGKNAIFAVVPYKGYSMDDSVVISQDFANKMASTQMYKFGQDLDDGIKIGKEHHHALFPDTFTKSQLDNIDENGVVKVGSVIKKGDPLILSTKPKVVSAKDQQLGRLSKYLKNTRNDASQVWDHENDGIVTDVVKTRHGYRVNVKSTAPMVPGDKATIRNGQKMTIAKILPTAEMPRTKVGTDENGEPIYQPVDVLFNPLGVVSRVNAASMMEILLGKVASRTGKHYVIPGFNKADENWYDFVKNEMDKHGITEKEDLYDPTMLDEQGNMKKLDNPVTVGNAYLYKLHHMGESKLSYRGQGIYSSNDQPAKGGESGMKSKRMSGLMTNALLSAGAYNYIKDGMHLRGQRNDDYWRAVRMGETPSLIKKSPFVWDQYLAIMQGAGINALDKGNGILQASPFTDRQFEALNPVEIKNAEIVDMKNLKPVEGGLFDPAMTLTKRWGKITLDRPYPNPGFENAIVSLLGIKKSDMMEIMRGDKALEGYGKGSEALYKALEDIDMDKMMEDAKDQFKNGPKSKKQQALNRIRYIAGLKKNNLTPNELMITKVPVLPSQYRPYSMRGDTFLPGDANELYKDVFLMNEAQKEIRNELGEEEANQNTANVYSSIKALYGFGEPNNQKLKQRGVSGFMNKLVGGTSKFSLLNRSVNSKPNDFTGRGVIDPDVELGMDEVGLPEEMAWTLFGPYISGKLVKGGMSPKAALENIEQKTEAARKALNQVIKERPVTVSRDPQWHKYNTLGGWVKLHNGKNILVNPVINSGAGADFNGDAQIGYIIGLVPNEMLKKGIGSDYLLLTKSNNKHHICSMFKNINIPVYDESKFTMSVMNIADMPHGKLLFEKQGKNGPISFYGGNGMKVLTMNETTSQTVWADVSCWSYHPQREVEIVNLDQGLQIITDNDPRAVYGLDINSEKYEFGRWTPTEAFEKHVVVPRGHVEHDIDESKTLKTIKFGGIDMNTSPEFGYFLGSMMGDGWVTDCIPTQWYISDLQGHVAKKNEKWLKTWIEDLKVTVKVFKKEGHPDRYGDTQRFTFSSIIRGKSISKDLKLFLDGHGDEKTAGSGNKKVPAFMASCPKDCIHAFLAGVFDTDGTIANTQAKVKKSKLLQASITSTSLQLLRDVKFLLGLIGVKSTISFSRTTTRGNKAWLLVCSAIDFYNKGKVIVEHMVDPKKVQAFMDADQPNADAACVVRLDKLPVLKTLMDLILKTLPSPKLTKALKESHPLKAKIVRELLNIKNNFKDGVKNKSYMVTRFSINTLRRMLVEYESYFNSEKLALLQSNANWHKLCQMADNKNMRWLSIKSVDYTRKKEDGYDLTVPGYDTFMNSDGVVLSNTMTVHVPGTAEAVKDVITKLMPSRQVLSIRDNKNVVNTLKQDFLLPLSLAASAKPSEQTYVFNTKKEALNALKSGRIKYTDDIIVKELEQ